MGTTTRIVGITVAVIIAAFVIYGGIWAWNHYTEKLKCDNWYNSLQERTDSMTFTEKLFGSEAINAEITNYNSECAH